MRWPAAAALRQRLGRWMTTISWVRSYSAYPRSLPLSPGPPSSASGGGALPPSAAFRRRLRTHHQKPPILGVFGNRPRKIEFMPLLDPPDRIPSERFLDLGAEESSGWSVLGCRHGRVLLINWRANVLLVFEPFSGDKNRIIIPPEFFLDGFSSANAAVLCAAGGDGACHSSPFKVVLVGTRKQQQRQQSAIACVYSSETGIWGDVASMAEPCTSYISYLPCTLIGTALYWCLNGYEHDDGILKFDLENQSLTQITKPPACPASYKSRIIRGEDGGLGVAILRYPSFQLWDRKVDCHGVATWVQRKNVNMDEMLGSKANTARIVAYAEDADAIFLSVYKDSNSHGLTIVQLESTMVKECQSGGFPLSIYHPLTNFYTAGTARTPVIEPHLPSSH